jgi:hypothetical protein
LTNPQRCNHHKLFAAPGNIIQDFPNEGHLRNTVLRTSASRWRPFIGIIGKMGKKEEWFKRGLKELQARHRDLCQKIYELYDDVYAVRNSLEKNQGKEPTGPMCKLPRNQMARADRSKVTAEVVVPKGHTDHPRLCGKVVLVPDDMECFCSKCKGNFWRGDRFPVVVLQCRHAYHRDCFAEMMRDGKRVCLKDDCDQVLFARDL